MIGVISDAHGNGKAFDMAISLLRLNGAKDFIFIGDAIGYLPSCSVLSSIEKLGTQISCVRGNHEQMLINNDIAINKDEIYQIKATRELISDAHFNMILRWPNLLELNLMDKNILFVHGSPSDPTFGYIYQDTDLSVFKVNYDMVFMGNTHRPFIRECGNTKFVNVGSCGLPRDDGRYGSVALLDPSNNQVRILRFAITIPSKDINGFNLDIHPIIYELFLRRSDNIIGEICQ